MGKKLSNLFKDKFLSLDEMTWIVAAERQRYRQKRHAKGETETFNCYVLDNGSIIGFEYDAFNTEQSELDTFFGTLSKQSIHSIEPFQVLYKTDDHWSTVSAQVIEGKLCFFLIDAANFLAPVYKAMLLIHKHFPKNVLTYCGLGIQKDSENCAYFALHDALFLAKLPSLEGVIKEKPSDSGTRCSADDESFLRQCGFSVKKNRQILNQMLNKVYFLQVNELPKNFGPVLKAIQTRTTYDKNYANHDFYILNEKKSLDHYVKQHMSFMWSETEDGAKIRLTNVSIFNNKQKTQENARRYLTNLSSEEMDQIQEERTLHKKMLSFPTISPRSFVLKKNEKKEGSLERKKYINETLKKDFINILDADIFYALTKLDPLVFHEQSNNIYQWLLDSDLQDMAVTDYYRSQNLTSRSSKSYIFLFLSYAVENKNAIRQFKQKLLQKIEAAQWIPTIYRLELYAFLGVEEKIRTSIKFEGFKHAYEHFKEVIEVLHRYKLMDQCKSFLIQEMNEHYDKQLDAFSLCKKLNTHYYKKLLAQMDEIPQRDSSQKITTGDSENNIASEARTFVSQVPKFTMNKPLEKKVSAAIQRRQENTIKHRQFAPKPFTNAISSELFKDILSQYHSSSYLVFKWSPFDPVRSSEMRALKRFAATLKAEDKMVKKVQVLDTLQKTRTCFNQSLSKKRLQIFLEADAKHSKKSTDQVLETLGKQFTVN